MNLKKKIFLIIIAIILFLMLTCNNSVNAGISGEYLGDVSKSGDNSIEAYISDEDILIIQLNPECKNIQDYEIKDYVQNEAPWYEKRKNIKVIQIFEGITSLGNNTFEGFSNLSKIIMLSDVMYIKDGAFANCKNDFKVCTIQNSYAEKYAQNNNYDVHILEEYDIIYNSNADGGVVTNMPENERKIQYYPKELSGNIPYRRGYRFDGWSIYKDIISGDSEAYITTIYDDKNTTIYADWYEESLFIDEDYITVSFDKEHYYYTGEEIKPILTIKNEDEILKENVDYTLEYRNNIEVGFNAEIRIKGMGIYKGETTVKFHIENDYATSIEIIKVPDKTEYRVLDFDDEVDFTGGLIQVNMISGKKIEIPMTDEKIRNNYVIYNEKVGEAKLKIFYDYENDYQYENYEENFIKSFNITVMNYLVCRKLHYCDSRCRYGELLYACIIEEYGDGSEIHITSYEPDKINFEGYDPYKVGEQEVIIKYKNFEEKVIVTVDNYLKSIEVKKRPNRTTYKIGEDIDLNGGILQLNMINGDIEEIEMEGNVKWWATESGVELSYTYDEKKFYAFLEIDFEDYIEKYSFIISSFNPYLTFGEDINIKIYVSKFMKSGKVENEELSAFDDNIKITGYDKNKIGKQIVTILYLNDSKEYLVGQKSINIYPREISKGTVTGIINKEYTGKNLTQNIVVKVDNVELLQGVDYIVSYKNNKNTGKATVTIKGQGNYAGIITKTFIITPKKVTGFKASSQTTSSIKLSWTKHTGVTGYKVYSYNYSSKKWEYVGKTSSTSYTVKKLKAGTTYKYRVRAYKTIDGKDYYGAYTSNIKTTTKTKTPSISSLTTKSKKATIKWKKVSGATGYEIYMATSKNGKYSKIKTITKGSTVSYTKSDLTKNKKYYFKIRTYRTVDGKKIYSSYSSAKSIKIK